MASSAVLAIRVVSDATKAQRDLDRLGGSASTMGDKVGRASKRAAAGLLALGAGALGATLKAEEVASANARVANVLGQMGYGEATDRVLKYAEALEGQLGVDEKVIKQAQATLSTFGEVAKSADTAGGAFDRATMAAIDLAAAGFGTAESNAVQLGKALNDPIKGLSALARSGVTFTETEKERIKTLVESGKIGKAQELVLAAIEKQVGGTAEATADSSAKMKLAFGEVVEQLGAGLLPAMDSLAPKVQRAAEWVGRNTKAVGIAVGVMAALAVAVIAVNAAMKVYAAGAAVAAAVTKTWAAAKRLATAAALGTRIQLAALAVQTYAVAAAQKAAAIATRILNAAMRANPLGLVITAITLLVALLVVAWKRNEKFRAVILKVWGAVRSGVGRVLAWFSGTLLPFFKALPGRILGFLKSLPRRYVAIYRGMFMLALSITRSLGGRVVSWIAGIPAMIGRLGGRFASAGRGLLQGFIDGMRNAAGIISGIAGNVWNAVRGLLNGAITKINAALEFRISLPGKDLHINPPNIPQLATGGVTSGPTLAVIGDNPSGVEYVIPKEVLDRLGGGSGTTIVEVHLDGQVIGRYVEKKVGKAVDRQARRVVMGAAS